MELLRDPRLLERIVEDFALCGVVGEETNKLVGYLGVVSRHSGSAACGHRAVEFGGGQKFADGSGARVPARRAARSILRHDRPVALLHGRAGL
jgi:DNA primase